jgi:hypothetical protein
MVGVETPFPSFPKPWKKNSVVKDFYSANKNTHFMSGLM